MKDALLYAAEMAHTEDGWIQPLLDAVGSTDVREAAWKPAPEVASIWEIVAHATPYIESRVCDFTGAPYPNEEDWPGVTDTSTAAWSAAQDRLRSAVEGLQSALRSATEESLASSPREGAESRARRLLDIIVHDAYHAGQIVKLQQAYRAAAQVVSA